MRRYPQGNVRKIIGRFASNGEADYGCARGVPCGTASRFCRYARRFSGASRIAGSVAGSRRCRRQGQYPRSRSSGDCVVLCAVEYIFRDAVVAEPGVQRLLLVEVMLRPSTRMFVSRDEPRRSVRPVRACGTVFHSVIERDGRSAPFGGFVHRTAGMLTALRPPMPCGGLRPWPRRVVGARPSRPPYEQQVESRTHCRRFAHVRPFGVEREAPDRRRVLLAQVAAAPADRFARTGWEFLALVDPFSFHGLEDLHRRAVFVGRAGPGPSITSSGSTSRRSRSRIEGNLLPMRASEPIPLRTISTSAPTRSHRLAISFMNEIRVASMALAAYLVISARECP